MARKPRRGTPHGALFDGTDSVLSRLEAEAKAEAERRPSGPDHRREMLARIEEEASLTARGRIARACGTRDRSPILSREELATMPARINALDAIRAQEADAVAAPIFADWVLRLRTAEKLGAAELEAEASAVADEAEAHANEAHAEEKQLRAGAPKKARKRASLADAPHDSSATIARRHSLYLRAVLAVVYGCNG